MNVSKDWSVFDVDIVVSRAEKQIKKKTKTRIVIKPTRNCVRHTQNLNLRIKMFKTNNAERGRDNANRSTNRKPLHPKS